MKRNGPSRPPLPSTGPDELKSMSMLALRARSAELNAVVAGLQALIGDAKGDIALAKAQMAAVRHEMSSRLPTPKDVEGKTYHSKGGHARAAAMSPDERREQASRAARMRWGTLDPEE